MATLPPLGITDEDQTVLRRMVRAGTTEQRMAVRARVVLAAAEGKTNLAIAAETGLSSNAVSKWRGRYAAEGLAGLTDRPRSGRRPVYGHDDRLAIVKQATAPPPQTMGQWTCDALAAELADTVGIGARQIHRILADLDLKPWQTRSWLTSHDPDFWDKAADVCGLYLDPPDNAMVYSVDEKTCIQAKHPINPTRPAGHGHPEHREFEYRRALHPTHASWLNQVELFFSILTRRLIRRGEFT